MGKDHIQEQVMQDLVSWRQALKAGLEALSQGKTQDIGKLVESADLIRLRLDKSLPLVRRAPMAKDYKEIMLDIKEMQDTLINELNRSSHLVKQKLDTLAKNRSLMQGYRKSRKVYPRFLSKLT